MKRGGNYERLSMNRKAIHIYRWEVSQPLYSLRADWLD